MTQIQATSRKTVSDPIQKKGGWPELTGAWRTAVRAVWVACAIIAIAMIIASLPGYLVGYSAHAAGEGAAANAPLMQTILDATASFASFMAVIICMALATLLFLRKPADGMALYVSFFLIVYGITFAGPLERLVVVWPDVSSVILAIQSLVPTIPLIVLLCLFPNGHFEPGWTRWLAVASLSWIPIVFLLPPLDDLPSSQPRALIPLTILALLLPLLGLYAQIYRYRKISTPVERQQTKWVIFGVSIWFAWLIVSSGPYIISLSLPEGRSLPLWVQISAVFWGLSLNIVPISLTIAVMRYRLWDIDLFINRTLVYSSLTVILAGIYILVVGGMGAIFQAQGNVLMALLATGLVAVLFQPIRARIQRGINRLAYGDKDDPVTALSRLGRRLEGTLEAEEVLPTLVENVAESLKLPYAAIELGERAEANVAAEYGKAVAGTMALPLNYHSEEIGRLVVGYRSSNASFDAADMRLLSTLARQAGAAVHGVQLTLDLKKSQQKLISAREEERRRLRRDLHDGLGPNLAAHMLMIGSARDALKEDIEISDRILDQLEQDLDATLGEVRRLVYNLRPPELDQLGLVGAIKRYADGYLNVLNSDHAQGEAELEIRIDAGEPVPALPAAVEVAAYRIVQEAVNNVVRHAQASRCQVKLSFNHEVHISVRDNGRGFPENVSAGIGLSSMRERAMEVGGKCQVSTRPGSGTQVEIFLPLVTYD